MRLLALVSGGIDSPVAAVMMAKEGHQVDFLHFSRGAYIPLYVKDRIPGGARMYVIPHSVYMEDVSRHLRSLGKVEWTCILCKYLMLRIAESVGGYEGLVTGDSLGQVASQTLKNLYVISRGLGKPVFRPLLGLDKVEIEALARRWGLMEWYLKDRPPTCPYLPKAVVTRATVKGLERALAGLEVRKIIDKALASLRVV